MIKKRELLKKIGRASIFLAFAGLLKLHVVTSNTKSKLVKNDAELFSKLKHINVSCDMLNTVASRPTKKAGYATRSWQTTIYSFEKKGIAQYVEYKGSKYHRLTIYPDCQATPRNYLTISDVMGNFQSAEVSYGKYMPNGNYYQEVLGDTNDFLPHRILTDDYKSLLFAANKNHHQYIDPYSRNENFAKEYDKKTSQSVTVQVKTN